MTEQEAKKVNDTGEETEEEDQGLSEAQLQELIKSIEARIAAGELDPPKFDTYVERELYPHLAEVQELLQSIDRRVREGKVDGPSFERVTGDDHYPLLAEVQALTNSIRKRVLAGEIGTTTFHRFVEQELYPLLADGTLSQETFTHIVQAWSRRNYPFDWMLKAYG